jgi:hypothetical protein
MFCGLRDSIPGKNFSLNYIDRLTLSNHVIMPSCQYERKKMFHHYRKHTFTFEKTIGSTKASNPYHFKAAPDIASMKLVILLSIFAMFPLLISVEVTYMHFFTKWCLKS